MTNAPSSPVQRYGGYALLAFAVVAAVAVGFYFFFFSSGDEKPAAALPDCSELANCSGVTPAPGTGPLDPQRPEEGKPAPNFALLDARDEKTLRQLSDFRGKAVVLNWYASWCDPCKREIPEFQALAEALPDQVVVLGVDPLESADDAAGILRQFGATYPAVLDSSGKVTDHYRVGQYLPKTYFIDKDGILRVIKTGEIKKGDLTGLLAQVGVTYAPN